MKCYCIANKNEDGALLVYMFYRKAYIRPCECPEEAVTAVMDFSEKYEIHMDSHWNCSARSDNGIDSNEITGSHVEKMDISQVVLTDDDLLGVYLPEYSVVIQERGSVIVNRKEEGYVGGWGDVCTYTAIYLRACK